MNKCPTCGGKMGKRPPVLLLPDGDEVLICFNCAMHNTDAELIQLLEVD